MELPAAVRFGEFELDPVAFKLRRGGAVVPLEPKALDLLQLLVARAPRMVDKTEIFSIVWKDVAVTDNALTRVVAQLRKALEDDPKLPRFIETIATRGYRFVAEVAPAEAPSGAASPADAPVVVAQDARAAPDSYPRSFRVAAVTAVVLAAIATGFWWARSIYSAPVRLSWLLADNTVDVARLATLRPEQMTTGESYDGFLAFAPDGKSLAFSSDRSGALEVYVQGIAAGSTAIALTSNGRQNVQPAWSPESQYVAYHEMAGDGIWITSSRGGVARKLTDVGSRPAWSPDGRRIAFQTIPPNDMNALSVPGALGTICVVDAEGRDPASCITKPGEPAGPHLSPFWLDNTQVAFMAGSADRGGLGLWSAGVNGGAPKLLARDERLSANYTLAPDRRSIVFVGRRTNALWWLPFASVAEEGAQAQAMGIQMSGAVVGHLTMSGRRVAWTSMDSSDHVWATSIEENENRSRATALTRGLGVRYGLPAPAADGRVAMVANRTGSYINLFLLERDATLRQLTTHPPNHGGPQWMPGEKEIAFITEHDEGPGYWAMDPATGRERPLFPLSALPQPPGESQPSTAAPAVNIAFARDFSRLVMAIVKDGRPNLWVAGLKHFRPDGTLVQRTFETDGGSYPAWSPDARWLAYQCAEGADTHVCVVDAANGDRTQLTHEPGQSWVGGWAADSDSIFFAARRNAVWNVASVSRSTGAVRTLTNFTGAAAYVRYPRWDDANKRVVFERSETTGRVWSVELPE